LNADSRRGHPPEQEGRVEQDRVGVGEQRLAARPLRATNGTSPAFSISTAARRHGQWVISASRKIRRREPTISGSSGSANRTTTARPVRISRERRDIERSLQARSPVIIRFA
jgi:hypothetical protein